MRLINAALGRSVDNMGADQQAMSAKARRDARERWTRSKDPEFVLRGKAGRDEKIHARRGF